MDKVPVEVVASIFKYAVPAYDIHSHINAYMERQATLEKVSLVCKWWYNIAMTTTELWSVVEIGFCARPTARVRRHLHRTKLSPLNILIYDHATRNSEPDMLCAISLLKSQAHRWRSAFLYTNISPKCILDFLPKSLPILEDAQILLSSFATTISGLGEHRATIRAPRLRDFTTNCAFALTLFDAPPLTRCSLSSTLTIQTRWLSSPLEPRLFHLVERLELASDFPWDDSEEDRVRMPKLEALHFNKCSTSFILAFLSRLDASSLRSIHMRDVSPAYPWPPTSALRSVKPCRLVFSGTYAAAARSLVSAFTKTTEWEVELHLRPGDARGSDSRFNGDLAWLTNNTRLSVIFDDWRPCQLARLLFMRSK